MDWVSEMALIFVQINLLDDLFVPGIRSTHRLAVREKENGSLIFESILCWSWAAAHDEVDALLEGIEHVCAGFLFDLVYEIEELLSLLIRQLCKFKWNCNFRVKENDCDAVFGSHGLDHGLDGVLYEVDEGEAEVFVLGLAVGLAGGGSAHRV